MCGSTPSVAWDRGHLGTLVGEVLAAGVPEHVNGAMLGAPIQTATTDCRSGREVPLDSAEGGLRPLDT
jgi:hypothetical protein